jgi:hypothetical protein
MKMHGDERLDRWVKKEYGENFDWVFLSDVDGEKVKEVLEDFVVLDDNGQKTIGIAIVYRHNDEHNETCETCGKKLSDVGLTAEEFDEHPDREVGYDTEGEWHCKDCRQGEEA